VELLSASVLIAFFCCALKKNVKSSIKGTYVAFDAAWIRSLRFLSGTFASFSSGGSLA
jgi:hypothetical protein